jgi:prevent-host-death family protein
MLTYRKSYHSNTHGGREDIVTSTFNVREARDRLYHLIDEVSETHQPVTIVGKRNQAVLLAATDWQAIQETLYLTGIPGMVESIRAGAEEPVEECISLENLQWNPDGESS